MGGLARWAPRKYIYTHSEANLSQRAKCKRSQRESFAFPAAPAVDAHHEIFRTPKWKSLKFDKD